MKRRIFSTLFAVVLVLSFSLVTAVPAMALPPVTVWVDDDYNSSTPTWGTTHFDKIQDGINGVATGGTVHVAAGTYTENVIIPKDKGNLKLLGHSKDDTIIQASSGNVIETKSGSPATIQGFCIREVTGTSGIKIRASGTEGSPGVIQDNRIGPFSEGRGIVFVSGNQWWEIKDNEITDCTSGIYFENVSNITVSGNTFSECVSACGGIKGANVAIINNNFSGSTETDSEAIGFIAGEPTNLTIAGNNITGHVYGIRVYSGFSEVGAEAHFNNIEGNSEYGVFNESTLNLNATNNWWGDDSGPSGFGPGDGDAVSNYVDYSPWLGAPLELPAVHYETLGPGSWEVDAEEEADTVVTLTVTEDFSETDIYIGEYESQPFPEEPFPDEALGKFIDVYLSNPGSVDWSRDVRIEVRYTDGEVRDAGIAEHSLGLYYYESVDTFHRCSDTGVDTTNNIIWANVTEEEAGDLVATPFGGGGTPLVGGEVLPVDKVSILMPWIGLAVALALAGVFVTRLARRRVRG